MSLEEALAVIVTYEHQQSFSIQELALYDEARRIVEVAAARAGERLLGGTGWR